MNKILRANIHNNLIYYRRNKLLLIVSLLFIAVMLLNLIPSLFFTSHNIRFRLALQIYTGIVGFTGFIVAMIGLISVWAHRSNKSVKLVFTKPCSPETWLLSHYISAGLVLLTGMLVSVVLYLALSLIWNIPIQAGILAYSFNLCVSIVLTFCYLVLLSAWLHPIIAGLVYLAFSENMFYWLALLCKSGIDTLESALLKGMLTVLHWITYGLYYVLPAMKPFEEKMKHLGANLRVPENYGLYSIGQLVYTLLFIVFCFSLTIYSLRKRRMN
jgi:ABC-type transport system involved in multi-copper enzyme maturation permease subunit